MRFQMNKKRSQSCFEIRSYINDFKRNVHSSLNSYSSTDTTDTTNIRLKSTDILFQDKSNLDEIYLILCAERDKIPKINVEQIEKRKQIDPTFAKQVIKYIFILLLYIYIIL